MGFKVYKKACENCLFSRNRIVSPVRAKEIIQECTKNQAYFICHKATIDGQDVCCKTFYDKFGHVSQSIRIAQHFGAIDEVDVPEGEKLLTYKEIKSQNENN